jgi:hypothetical protein
MNKDVLKIEGTENDNIVELVDGSVIANNPTLVALMEVETAFPGRPIASVVSIGSGYLPDREESAIPLVGVAKWILEIANQTENTHCAVSLHLATLEKIQKNSIEYFRFHPKIPRNFSLDAHDESELDAMEKCADEFIDQDPNIFRLCQFLNPSNNQIRTN